MDAPRSAVPTVTFVDEYCAHYSHLFPEVRTFENFKYFHLGMVSDIKRKSLPAIARSVGLHDSQPLQKCLEPLFLVEYWSMELLQLLDPDEDESVCAYLFEVNCKYETNINNNVNDLDEPITGLIYQILSPSAEWGTVT